MLEGAAKKNETFATEIRQRQRQKYFKTQRLLFTNRIGEEDNKNKNAHRNIQANLKKPPTPQSVLGINTYIGQNLEELKNSPIKQQPIMQYISVNFLWKDNSKLVDSYALIDLVTLTSNLIRINGFDKGLLCEHELRKIVIKIVDLVDNVNQQVGEGLLFLVAGLMYVTKKQDIGVYDMMVQKTIKYGKKYSYVNYYFLSYLYQVSKYFIIEEQCLQELVQLKVKNEEEETYGRIIQIIFESVSLHHEKNKNLSQMMIVKLIKWIQNNLMNKNFPLSLKSNLVFLLANTVSRQFPSYIYYNIINSPCLLTQIMNRLEFDERIQTKINCSFVIFQLIKYMSADMVQQLIRKYQQVIDVIVHSLRLYNNEVIRQGLSAIVRIIMIDKPMILKMIQQSTIRNELNWLMKHQVRQISDLAVAIKQTCFQYEL